MEGKVNSDIKTIIKWFEEYCIDEKGHEEKTASQYKSFLERYLLKHFKESIDLSDINILTEEKLLNLKQELTGAMVRYSFGAFNNFLFDRGFIDESRYKITFKNIISKAFPIEKNDFEREIEYLSPYDIRKLFSDEFVFKTEEDKYIFPLVVGLSYFCLFNQKELIAINISDISLEYKTIKNIRERGNINYAPYIKINDNLFLYLNNYLKYRAKAYPNINYSSLLIYKGEPVDNSAFGTIYSKAFSKTNEGLLKTSKLNTGIILKSSILYMLRHTKNNIILELSQLIGTNFFSTTYFVDAFEEYRKNELELKEYNEALLQELNSNLPQVTVNREINTEDPLLEELIPYLEENDISLEDIEDYDMNIITEPNSSKITIQRLVRDSKISRKMKLLYKNSCLVCETTLRKSNGEYYSEAHHIKPYNKIQKGNDAPNNIIVLCSNCHTQFDDSYYAIHPKTKILHCLFEDDKNHLKPLSLKHSLDKNSLEYAWNLHLSKNQNFE